MVRIRFPPAAIYTLYRPAIGFQHIAPAAKEVPADQADDSDERDASNHDVSISVASPRRKVVQQHGRKRAVVERELDGDKTYVLWFMWCRLEAE